MINEPTANAVHGAMQNPRTRTSESTSTDPVRRNLGDKTEDAPKDADPAKVDDKGQVDEDAGEGHKGPRTETMTPGSRNGPQGDHSSPSKTLQTNVNGGPGVGNGTSAKDPEEAKPTGTRSGGSTSI